MAATVKELRTCNVAASELPGGYAEVIRHYRLGITLNTFYLDNQD